MREWRELRLEIDEGPCLFNGTPKGQESDAKRVGKDGLHITRAFSVKSGEREGENRDLG